MTDVSLRIGQTIRLAVENALTQGELEGSVLLIGKKDLMLSFPDYRELPGVAPKARAVLSVWDDFGLHQGKTRVIAVNAKPYPGLIVERPADFMTRQKRGYFRLATSMTVTAVPPQGEAWRAVTDDISAGGVKFRTLREVAVGDRLVLTVDFPRVEQALSYEAVPLQARVVRVASVQVDDEIQHTVCCQFENVREIERDRLVKLLLDLQSRAR